MTSHKIGTREEWLAARNELLAKEKELTRRNDQLAAERRDLPWVPVEKEYRFETAKGPKTLAELFDGRSTLIVYHFMFGPAYEAGCPTCSSMADSFNGAVPHLNARDVTFTCVSRAPMDKIQAYKTAWAGASHGRPHSRAITTSTGRPLTLRRRFEAGWRAAFRQSWREMPRCAGRSRSDTCPRGRR